MFRIPTVYAKALPMARLRFAAFLTCDPQVETAGLCVCVEREKKTCEMKINILDADRGLSSLFMDANYFFNSSIQCGI